MPKQRKRDRDRPWRVVDQRPGLGEPRTMKRCATEAEALAWMVKNVDPTKIESGGIAVLGPEPSDTDRIHNERRIADRIDGFDRDDLGESPDH